MRHSLTFVPASATVSDESRSLTGRRPVTPADGAGAVPAGAGSSPALPGGFGQTSGRHDDRPAAMSLDWDRRRRVTPVSRPRPRKNVLELSGGVRSSPQAPWWDADRRAVPAGAATASRQDADGRTTRLSASRRPVFIWVNVIEKGSRTHRRQPQDDDQVRPVVARVSAAKPGS